MAIADTISSMYENVGEVYDTITNVDVNNGKNLFNDTIRQGVTTYDGGVYSYNATRLTSTNWTTLRAGTYTINAKTNTSKTLQISNITFDTNDNFYNLSGVSGIWKTLPFTFTTPIDIKWKCNFDYSDNSNITINEVNSIQLELGSSATEYQPYTDNPTYKNIENIPKVIRKSYLNIMNNGIDTIYDNWEKVNGTGTSITLNNTEEAPMTIEYKGNTSQYSTTGKNMLSYTLSALKSVNTTGTWSGNTYTLNNVTFTLNDDFSIATSGTANAQAILILSRPLYDNGEYILSGCPAHGSASKYRINWAYAGANDYGSGATVNYTGTTGQIRIIVESGINVSGLTFYPMVRLSSITDGTYEPYTNGASPNPDFPQPINVVSGDNYINVVGKNLFDEVFRQGNISITSLTTRVFSTQNLYLESGQSYTISTNLNTSLYKYAVALSDTMYPVPSGFYDSGWQTISSFTFTPSRSGYFGLGIAKSNGTDNITPNDVSNFNWQLEKGNQVTDFQPYQNASYEINLPVENYLPNNATTQTINGITYTINEDKSIKINGTASGRADLWLYGSITDTGNYVFIPKGNYTMNTANLNDGTMFLSFREKTAGVRYMTRQNNGLLDLLAQQDCYFYGIMLGVESGKTINNLTFYPQIEKGTKLNSYTTYGTTPIYLASIPPYKNRIFKSSGKNLFDLETAYHGTINAQGEVGPNESFRTTQYITSSPNTNYYFSTTQKIGQTNKQIYIAYYDSNKTFLSRDSYNELDHLFTTPINCYYIRAGVFTANQENVMLNEGSTALPYEPYGKDWYLNKQIGKFTYNNEGSVNAPATNYYNISGLGNRGWLLSLNTKFYLSNKYEAVKELSTDGNFQTETANMDYAFGIHTNGTTIRFKDSRGLSGADFKTDLIGTEIYFALATPTYEKITGELLNQLEAIKNSYENQTNINQENNDLPFELEVGALEKY